MPSERIQRRIENLLDQAEVAADQKDWTASCQLAEEALALDEANQDAMSLLAAARSMLGNTSDLAKDQSLTSEPSSRVEPTAFANGRYTVKKFLGEGGKKKVYLAHDSLLDRDVAFALIKTEGLDAASRERVTREAQAMGRLGAHPHIVTVFDIGEEDGQPYLVLPVLAGGDVEGVIEKAPDHKLPIEQVIKIATETCQGLEFVHAKGIVHRDLKPGNVWLTEDGRAMIGDFGLAIAMDRSRLTQAGMMVGTVNYMPPEQAMGGLMDARSDLYSLGAMLYEMVCGRPPFVGDESVAIIGQHLNTPPVAPRWHRPDCPPALETLLLRLLQKDPARRPASAAEVRQALESIDLNRQRSSESAPQPGTGASESNPLYRRTFVGREAELKQLEAAFDAALSGDGGLVMVVGEPGIGKTALCEQLVTYATLRGGKALVGHSYEEGSLSLPYLAFVEAMRSYVLDRDPEGLRSELGSGAGDVARIVSEVRDRIDVELRQAGDPDDDRWRLMQAITGFLRNASTVQPMLVVLEDLHWADRGTLDLLQHVARNLQGARLLIAGTYRDVEVDRSHPLASALAELRRSGNFGRVALRGLSIDEVQRMMSAIRGHDVAYARAEQIHRQTEGHPLFIQEVLRYMVEEGIVVRADGRYAATDPSAYEDSIPEGLREVVGKRLSHLSEKTNQVLTTASVIGRDFRLDLLQRVAGLAEEELYAALEEATDRAVIEQRQVAGAVAFRFTHAFFRQTLYEEIFVPRRIRLHQQVGRALEEVYARRLEEHAAELAEHFAQSTETADLKKAVKYGELAAERSMAVFAYGEAVRLLEQALRAQEVLAPGDRAKRCALLLTLGQGLLRIGETRRAMEVAADEAFQDAEQRGDQRQALAAGMLALEAISRWTGAGVLAHLLLWLERCRPYVEAGTREQVFFDTEDAARLVITGELSSARDKMAAAVALADELGDIEARVRIMGNAVAQIGSLPDGESARIERARDFYIRTYPHVRTRMGDLLYMRLALALLAGGERSQAEKVIEDELEVYELTRDAQYLSGPSFFETLLAFIDGRLADVESKAQATLAIHAASGRGVGQLLAWAPQALALLGRNDEALAALDKLPTSDNPLQGQHLLRQIISNDPPSVRKWLDAHRQHIESVPELSLFTMLLVLETVVVANDTRLTKTYLERLAPAADVTFEMARLTTPARQLGAAAGLLGDKEGARNYFEQAIRVAGSIGFRPEVALSHLQLAELLLEHYPEEHDAAIEHLDFAIMEFQAMKMQPSLERALRHRGLLKA